MPATPEEIEQLADAVAEYRVAPDQLEDFCWTDGTRPTEPECDAVLMRAVWLILDRRGLVDRDRRDPESQRVQRRAMRILRRHLTPTQLEQLRKSSHYFYVTAPSGNVYKIYPIVGMTFRCELHGKRYFTTYSYCYHDPPNQLPPADIALTHAMLISCDEAEFLREANARFHRNAAWDPEYRHRLRARAADRAEVRELAAQAVGQTAE